MSTDRERKPPMMKGKQAVTSVNLPPADIDRLDQIAARRRASRAQIIREAVVEYLDRLSASEAAA